MAIATKAPDWRAVPPRQITGAPYRYWGYIQRAGDPSTLRHCHEGEHRGRNGLGAEYAMRCALRAAHRLNRAERKAINEGAAGAGLSPNADR